jgi:hypothetical protein
MDVVQEFQKHANECRWMSRFTHDRESKAVWNRMAERWLALMIKEQERMAQYAETTRLVHRRAGHH